MSTFIGHYAPRVLLGVVASLVFLTVAPIPAGVSAQIVFGALLVLMTLTLVLAVAIFSHNRRLCERCIRSVPLNASAVASKYKARFRIAHYFERRAFAAAYLLAVTASSFFGFHPAGKYPWAVVQASLGYLLLVYATHQRLQPWCPFCRGGGEHEVVPTSPTPVSSSL
jgi:hypothetical protein